MMDCQVCEEHEATTNIGYVMLCPWCSSRIGKFIKLRAEALAAMPGSDTQGWGSKG
jgi:hypothetical protein